MNLHKAQKNFVNAFTGFDRFWHPWRGNLCINYKIFKYNPAADLSNSLGISSVSPIYIAQYKT